ncbi:MAG: 4Fe-4S binding protein [Candidatus Tritonobacter lacicola]|nr:4Fe-4S binding protein [Candidatus Tritonobacter lacicola]
MIVAVAGGKGGTGKTFVSTSLAVVKKSLRFLDCDVEEPDAHIYLRPAFRRWSNVSITTPLVRAWKAKDPGKLKEAADFCRYNALAFVRGKLIVFEELCTGCGGCFKVCPDGSLIEKEQVVGVVKDGAARDGIEFVMGELKVGKQRTVRVIEKVRSAAGESGDVLIDCPPGSGRPALAAMRGSDFCVLVTEPTPFGLHDLAENIELLGLLGIPAGVVLNRSGGTYRGVETFCRDNGIPVLLEIPFTLETARSSADGKTLPDIDPAWSDKLAAVWNRIN